MQFVSIEQSNLDLPIDVHVSTQHTEMNLAQSVNTQRDLMDLADYVSIQLSK